MPTTTDTARGLTDIVADLRGVNAHAVDAVAGAHDRIHALEATAARLTEERDEARQAGLDLQRENSALLAAGLAIAKDAILREENLKEQLDQAAVDAAFHAREALDLKAQRDTALLRLAKATHERRFRLRRGR